jgi:hypothetical protein
MEVKSQKLRYRIYVLACFISLLIRQVAFAQTSDYFGIAYGELLPGSTEQIGLWWASSGWKISPDKPLPQAKSQAVTIRAARNEAEAVQLVVRPSVSLSGFAAHTGALTGPDGAFIPADNVEVLKVRYVNVVQPTDKSSVSGLWPDPLPPLKGPIDLEPGKNQPFWVRVKVPRQVPAGIYTGSIHLAAQNHSADVMLYMEVYDFMLPDRMTCTTAFGFSPGNVFRYQKLSGPEQKRQVLEKYWANFSAHHISPYDPVPLDGIGVDWPDIKPTPRKWSGGREVKNEKHSGDRSLLVYDDRKDLNVDASYEPLIEIPAGGLRLRLWYRTALPDHALLVSLTHYDASGKWISGHNNDISLEGNGHWQQFDRVINQFPKSAKSVRLHLRATKWTESGEDTGLAWFDDISLTDAATGKELLEGGGFEPPPLPPFAQDKLRVKFDFTAWDKAMERAIDYYHFNSFRLSIPGLGGGTFHARYEPTLLGFSEDTPHYKVLFESYCRQLQEHLRQRGWLDEAYVYWFDEPAPRDYEFVMNGFRKLKSAAPDINRMLTEQVEPKLIGGPNIWCPVSPNYKHEPAEQRRQHGEKFWWYVCTGPKAPYCTLFIDHPGTELRVWLWQTWQRKINGILVWATDSWTSSAAYPDPDKPQNPYEDPMGWTSGYSTPQGVKRPWGNGDGRFIYPPEAAADAHPSEPVLDGPVESIRWEMLRDGIEDYEYLAMLDGLLRAKKGKLTAQQREEYTALLEVPESITKDMTTFTKDPAPIEVRRDKIARAIARLNKL